MITSKAAIRMMVGQLAGERAQEEGAEAAFHPEWLNAGNKKPINLEPKWRG